MKILIDTNAYSSFKRGNSEIVTIIRAADEILFPVIVLGELKAGFKTGDREKNNVHELNEFLSSPRIRIVDVTEDTTEFYAEIYRELRKTGNPVPTNDLWIASLALEHGAFVVTGDAHFRSIPGIIVKPSG